MYLAKRLARPENPKIFVDVRVYVLHLACAMVYSLAMTYTEGNFEVKLISHQALAQYMDFRHMSVRGLATRAGVSRALVGHLHSGARSTVRPASAHAIARALDCPTEALFVPRVVHVARDTVGAA